MPFPYPKIIASTRSEICNHHQINCRETALPSPECGKVRDCMNTSTAVSAALAEDRTFVDLSLSRTLLPNQSETIRFNLN